MPRSRNVSTTCSASFLRSRPWSTSTHVSWSPTARCTSAAAAAESTPPERPQITPPSPTWARTRSTCSPITDAGRPALLEAGEIAQETIEDLGAVRRVDDLRVELDPVQAAVRALARGHRRGGAGGERHEARRGLEHRVAVAHPALLLVRQPGHQATAAVGERERGAAELARVSALDPPAERLDHGLHPVTDAEHWDAQLEQLAPQLGRALRVDGRGAAREHEGGWAGAPGSERARCRGARAPRTRRSRESAGRSAGSTAPRNRGPVPSSVIRDGDLPWRRRARPFEPMPTDCCAGAACPRSEAPGRPSPRRAGSRGCPRSRRWPSRCGARPSG